MIVADSDVLIDSLRGREPALSRISLELKTGQLATTAVNAFELLAGARSQRETEKVDTLLGAMTIIVMDRRAAQRAAAVRRDLEARGQKIGMADYLIAGICLEHDAILLTRNRAHFERVPGLCLGELGGA